MPFMGNRYLPLSVQLPATSLVLHYQIAGLASEVCYRDRRLLPPGLLSGSKIGLFPGLDLHETILAHLGVGER
jgi:hypothetical protein